MKRLFFQSVIAIFASVLLNTATAEEEQHELGPDIDYRGSDCISIRSIRDYTVLDDRNLLVWAGSKRPYFVTLQLRAFNLRSSFRLGFSSTDGRLCPYGRDRIVLDGLQQETVGIRYISRVTPEQADELLIRYGHKEPGEERAPAPEPVIGAEVEELD